MYSLIFSYTFYIHFILFQDKMERYDVLIVGGGISGLVAAKTLLQHDPEISIALLEAKPSLGGRIESLRVQVLD